jgi:hypothetical protein
MASGSSRYLVARHSGEVLVKREAGQSAMAMP